MLAPGKSAVQHEESPIGQQADHPASRSPSKPMTQQADHPTGGSPTGRSTNKMAKQILPGENASGFTVHMH
jgi:hypothetical protein